MDTDNNCAWTSQPRRRAPRNTASPLRDCSGDAAPFIAATTPADNATGVALDSNVTITFSEPVTLDGRLVRDHLPATATTRPRSAAAPRPSRSTPPLTSRLRRPCEVVVAGGQVSDQDTVDPPDTVVGNPSWSFMTASPPPPTVAIHAIQGSLHTSPFAGMPVTTTGIVTAKRTNGFYMQDPTPDADPTRPPRASSSSRRRRRR